MAFVRESVVVGGKELSIETGRMAKQADGSVVVRYGDTMVLVTAVAAKTKREIDFMPLTCEYQERTGSAGKIPGGYFKREGRPTEAEILTARLMDRPSRPLFPKGWRFDTQIISFVISSDRENSSDVLAMIGSSTALHISDIPWAGPYAGVRVGQIDGKFVLNPTFSEQEKSDFNIVMACSRDAIVMVEGSAKGVSESVLIDGLYWGHEQAQPILDLQDKLRAAVGKVKRPFEVPAKDAVLAERIKALGWDKVQAAFAVKGKHERHHALDAVRDELKAALAADYPDREKEVLSAYEDLMKKFSRELVLSTATRIDGRGPADIRSISCEVGVLPRTHGSSLFTRGETQALVTTTLGTNRDEQRIDSLAGDVTKRFMLHYNFPPFSTGESKPMRGSSRREIGHGNLAERALKEVLPATEDFPYVIRVVSDTLESNGSSSMAAVCGGCLSLMDAGVPIKAPVAGIAMGLIYDKSDAGVRFQILSDILGDEDHLGDMDFKVTGTKQGVNSFQMDIKIQGLSRDIMTRALEQARLGRLHILDKMAEALQSPRDNLSTHAPRIYTLQVKPDKIRDIIGPGGKMIRAIIEQTGVAIDVEDDGTVSIASSDEISAQKAISIIKGLTQEPTVGEFYTGTVKRIAEFGAFVEILPGTDGLVHISEVAAERIRRVEDVLKEGDEVLVKVIAIDKMGKIRLSRKDAIGQTPDKVNNLQS